MQGPLLSGAGAVTFGCRGGYFRVQGAVLSCRPLLLVRPVISGKPLLPGGPLLSGARAV